MAGWDKLTAGVIGVGVGEAAGAALEPVLDPLKQDAWAKRTPRVLDLGELAQLAASGLISEGDAISEGGRSGFSPDRVRRAIQLTLTAAPVAELLELWRRGKISADLVDHGLAKARIEPQYWGPIKELFYGRLDPAVVATAIQRGIMKDPGFLPVGPPTTAGKIKAFPVSTLDALEEAKAQGIDESRLFVETAIVGLPLALVQAAQAYYRGIIELDDFHRAVAEGNTRNEWGDAALEVSRQILTAGQYEEAALRGVLTNAEADAKAAQHGMSQEDARTLFAILGRSLAVHQITTGLARGGTFGGTYADVPEPYRDAIRRSNIRPEYAVLAHANRYSYPSGFQIRAEAQKGDLTAADTQQLLLEVGWSPKWATFFADKWTGGATAAANPHVTKADTQLWNTAHASYKARESTAADVAPVLTLLGLDGATQTAVLERWDAERALIRKQLSPAQIKKAYKSQTINLATGVAWTFQDAIAALLARGYDQADAETLLAE